MVKVEVWGHSTTIGGVSIGDSRGPLDNGARYSIDIGDTSSLEKWCRGSPSLSNTESNIDASQDNIWVGFSIEEGLGFIVSLKDEKKFTKLEFSYTFN